VYNLLIDPKPARCYHADMSIWLRRLIFWGFVLSFFLLAPTLVFYTAGYQYNAQYGLVRTGVLSVITSPRAAAVTLNGADTNKKTPEVFKRVTPDDYDVIISRDGYYPWTGQTEVLSGQTTILENILLFLQDQPELIITQDFQQLTPHPDGTVVAYRITQGGWEEIWLLDINSHEHTLVDQHLLPDGDTQEAQLTWSKDGTYLASFTPTSNRIGLYTKSGDIIETADTISHPTSLTWHPSEDALLAINTEDGLVQLNVASGTSQQLTSTDATSIQLDQDTLSFVDNGSFVELQNVTGSQKDVIALLPRGDYSIHARDGSLLLLQKEDELFVISLKESQPILFQQDVTSFDWLEDEDSLVYTDGNEIRLFDARSFADVFITRLGDRVNSIHWHPSGKRFFAQIENRLVTYDRYIVAEQRNVTTLIDNAEFSAVWISKNGSQMFFFGKKDGAQGVYSMKLTDTLLDLDL
jgi:hypothetical protein